MKKNSKVDFFYEKIKRAEIKCQNYFDRYFDKFNKNNINIVGCYNTSNIGDLAFKYVLKSFAINNNIKVKFYSFGNIKTINSEYPTIVGGGGVLTSRVDSPLLELVKIFKNNPGNIFLLGVSGLTNQDEWNYTIEGMISNFNFVSLRSEYDFKIFKSHFNKVQSQYHPDLVFSLPVKSASSNKLKKTGEKQKIGINATPFLMKIVNGKFQKEMEISAWYSRNFPEESKLRNEICDNYISLLKNTAEYYIKQGWDVCHVSFALEDWLFAKSVFSGQDVKVLPFKTSPLKVFSQMEFLDKFIATRFHSLVFCLKLGVPVIPICYANKCHNIIDDFGLGFEGSISLVDLGKNKVECQNIIIKNKGYIIEPSILKKHIKDSDVIINKVFSSLNHGVKKHTNSKSGR